ncbi:MAG: hypothetical protein WDA65_04095 [Christensenellales bacterium]
MRVWGKIKNEDVICSETTIDAISFQAAVDCICSFFDLSKPLICAKHFSEIEAFSRTVFFPDDFVEKVSFDVLEVEIIGDVNKPEI